MFKVEEDVGDSMLPKRWSLPEFPKSRHSSLENLNPDSVSPGPTLLLDTETLSETNGINLGAGSAVSPDMLYLMENLDTKETDILEFNNEPVGESPKGMPQSSRIWF
jgi:bestrophin-3